MSGYVMRPGVCASTETPWAIEEQLLNDKVALHEPVPIVYPTPHDWFVIVFPPGDDPIPWARVAEVVEASSVAEGLEIRDAVEVTGIPTFDDAHAIANALRTALRGGGV